MFTKTDIEKYFNAEKSESLLFLLIGIAGIIAAISFYFFVKEKTKNRKFYERLNFFNLNFKQMIKNVEDFFGIFFSGYNFNFATHFHFL